MQIEQVVKKKEEEEDDGDDDDDKRRWARSVLQVRHCTFWPRSGGCPYPFGCSVMHTTFFKKIHSSQSPHNYERGSMGWEAPLASLICKAAKLSQKHPFMLTGQHKTGDVAPECYAAEVS